MSTSVRWLVALGGGASISALVVACGPSESRRVNPAPGNYQEPGGDEVSDGTDGAGGFGGMGGSGALDPETPRGIECGSTTCQVGTCSDDVDGPLCVCPERFGPATEGCPDINECEDASICGEAACVNTVGGFYCECEPGEMWTGDECVSSDPCSANSCDDNASCDEVGGDYSCSCAPGFVGNGEFCKETADCTGTCGDGSCEETLSGFACQCDLGHAGATDCATECSELNLDAVLEALIRETVGLPVELGPLEPIHVEALDSLDASNTDVRTLDGLQCWPHLKHLNLAGSALGEDLVNYPAPLEAVRSLNQLETLNLGCTSIEDLTGLEGHPTLEEIRVDNQGLGCEGALVDPSAVAELTRLEVLVLGGNPLESFPQLSTGRLTYLDLNGAGLTELPDFSQLLRLESLFLAENAFDDVSGISNLGRLVELHLAGNQVTSLDAMTNLPALRVLRASNNQIETVSALEGMPGLVELDLSVNDIDDVSTVAAHSSISTLYLAGNKVSELAPFVDSGFAGVLSLNSNPIDCDAQSELITALIAQGVQLYTDCE